MTARLAASAAPDHTHSRTRVLAALALLVSLGLLATDVFLPALPGMERALGAGPGALELTITGAAIGGLLGVLVWGPIGDRFGRRGPMAFGMVLFLIGTAGCALSQSVAQLIAWRVVQAFGVAGPGVLARAMVRDLYEGEEAARMLSTLVVILAVGPLLGPLLGGQILLVASWRAIFWTLFALGLTGLGALATLPETLPPERRTRHTLGSALAGYGMLLRERTLMTYAAIGAFLMAGLLAYVAGSPAAYIGYYKVPAQAYGLLFALGVIGVMAANAINARLVQRLGIDRLIRLGAAGAAMAALALLGNAMTGWGGLVVLAASLSVFVAMQGFVLANAMAGALQKFPNRAGAVAALIAAIHAAAGIVGSLLLSFLADGTPRPMAWVVVIAAIGMLASVLTLPVTQKA